jgi:hypothetical protein
MRSNMPKRFYAARLARYYRKHGLVETLSRLMVGLRRSVACGKTILFCSDLFDADEVVPVLPDGSSIETLRQYSEIHPADLQRLFDHLGGKKTEYAMQERFKKGTALWLLREHNQVVSFLWSARGKTVAPFYLPLTPEDVHLFDAESFPEQRGRGFYPLLVRYVCCKLREDGVSRVYMDVKMWNVPSIRGLAKTPFRYYGVASLLRVFGKTITIWHEIPSSARQNRVERHQNNVMIEKTENKVVMCLKQK